MQNFYVGILRFPEGLSYYKSIFYKPLPCFEKGKKIRLRSGIITRFAARLSERAASKDRERKIPEAALKRPLRTFSPRGHSWRFLQPIAAEAGYDTTSEKPITSHSTGFQFFAARRLFMNKACVFLIMGALALVFFTGPPAAAQNAVVNPCFTTSDFMKWTHSDPTYSCVPGNSSWGMNFYCARKNPGAPSNNGSIVQSVHLIAGYTYEFSANIAAKYCTS
jgi:hypothetical protein